MGWLSNLFGGGKDKPGVNHQLPSTMVAKEFGEVNVRRVGKDNQILFTILMEPTGTASEGWQTGVALDASGSMMHAFGKGIEPVPGKEVPDHVWQDHIRRGWLTFVQHQGQQIPIPGRQCMEDLVRRGYFVWSKNEVEPLARRMTAYLASNLDADGGTTVIYWACGDGRDVEVIGDYTAEQCELAAFEGPDKVDFGSETHLMPAVKYFAERFADAKNGMYIFVTDGELNDLEEVKRYTIRLCKDIAAGKRNPLKCVLIGIGENINEDQMEQLDDLESGTDVDIWDHKIAKEMRALVEIFAEVVSEHQIVAPTARIFSEQGELVKNFTDGLPARVSFAMPAESKYFELEVEGQRIRQSVVVPR
jgi:hypothetical protein